MYCDKETCDMLDKVKSSFHGFKDIVTDKPQTNENGVTVEMDDYSSIVNKSVINTFESKEKEKVDTKIKEDLIKEQFKPLMYPDSIENNKNIFESNDRKCFNKEELKKSGIVVKSNVDIDIDDQVIELIEDITKQDPRSFVMLKRTKSGHLSLNINSVSDDTGENILIKKSPSGNMVMEIDENTIQGLKKSNNKKESSAESNSPVHKKIENYDPVNTPGTSKPVCEKIDKFTQNEIAKFLLRNSKEKFSVCKRKCQTPIECFIKKLYEEGQRNVEVTIYYYNKDLVNTQATLTQLSNENIAIHVKNPGIPDSLKVEYQATINRTKSSTINICFDTDVSISNCVAKRTISDGFLIHLKERLEEVKPCKQKIPKTEEVIKIKLKGLDNAITEPPAVMKLTPSGNYDIILEKEFEKAYTQTIKHQTGQASGSFFEITKTSSGIVLDFEKNDCIKSESKKALLMKSHSGLLKVIISSSKSSVKEEVANKKRSPVSGSMLSTKTLTELLKKLPSTQTVNKQHVGKSKPTKTKSSSDSHLSKKSRNKLQSSQSLLEKSSSTLRKTPSGQYAVFLDKKSKISIINNLISYIEDASAGVIPIKRTESGEITINFNKKVENLGQCGSMKVTSSGNIYVILDEKAITRISNHIAVNTSYKKGEISPYVSKIENPDNKAVATTCNANPEDSSCDASKCVCERFCGKDFPNNSFTLASPKVSHRLCDKSKCLGASDKQNIRSNKPPHIVIRPSEARPMPNKHNTFEQSYYCEVQSMCPYHKDRYEGVSNELLEISSLCNNSHGTKLLQRGKTSSKIKPVKPKNSANSTWNSFEYLPPQLPPFLRNLTYN